MFFLIQTLLGILIIFLIMKQPAKSSGIQDFAQNSNNESFFSKNKLKSKEIVLARLTGLSMVFFMINTILLNTIK